MAAAAEPGEIDARAIDAIGFRDMVEKLVQLFDIPILIGAEQRRDGEKGEAGIAVGDLRRAVDLDLRDIVAALARAVEEDQHRILLLLVSQISLGDRKSVGKGKRMAERV